MTLSVVVLASLGDVAHAGPGDVDPDDLPVSYTRGGKPFDDRAKALQMAYRRGASGSEQAPSIDRFSNGETVDSVSAVDLVGLGRDAREVPRTTEPVVVGYFQGFADAIALDVNQGDVFGARVKAKFTATRQDVEGLETNFYRTVEFEATRGGAGYQDSRKAKTAPIRVIANLPRGTIVRIGGKRGYQVIVDRQDKRVPAGKVMVFATSVTEHAVGARTPFPATIKGRGRLVRVLPAKETLGVLTRPARAKRVKARR